MNSIDIYILHKIINFRYKIALNLRYEVQLFLDQKDYENAIMVLNIIFENFKSAVCDQCLM